MSLIYAPWDKEQAAALNRYQNSVRFHPYTCGNRGDGAHSADAVLVATEHGWICPHCSYTQVWAHDQSFTIAEPV
jgi:hypothetical protein